MKEEELNEKHYDTDYFFDYNQYQDLVKQQPEPMLPNFGEHCFEFYQFGFQNGVSVFLFESKEESEDFVNYMSFNSELIHCGLVSDCTDRVLTESIKRNTNEFTQLCEQLDDNKPYSVIYSPFKLPMTKDNPFE